MSKSFVAACALGAVAIFGILQLGDAAINAAKADQFPDNTPSTSPTVICPFIDSMPTKNFKQCVVIPAGYYVFLIATPEENLAMLSDEVRRETHRSNVVLACKFPQMRSCLSGWARPSLEAEALAYLQGQ